MTVEGYNTKTYWFSCA